MLKLNLGSGKRDIEGYVNIDAVKQTGNTVLGNILDLKYESVSIDEIYSEHVIEHLDKNELNKLFSECSRVLKIGGRLVLIAPCLVNTIKDYINGNIDITYLENFLYALHEHKYDYHKQGIYKEKLELLCVKHGLSTFSVVYQTRGREREIILTATKENK